MIDLPLINGRQPFILECNRRFCVIYDEASGPRLFLYADGEWRRPEAGVDDIHRFKSREAAEAFVMKHGAREGVRCD